MLVACQRKCEVDGELICTIEHENLELHEQNLLLSLKNRLSAHFFFKSFF